jgi:hypothetical protein
VVWLITVHSALLAFGAVIHSPTWDEPGHLVAGISHWQFGDFRAYHVNPPLVRMVAASPVLLAGPQTDWSHYSAEPFSRPEFSLGRDFVNANGPRVFRLFTLARLACIPFSIAGALVCWQWGRSLYGSLAGMVALTIWTFCPNILAFGQLITPDVAATSFGVLASFLFWRWLRAPAWQKVPLLGITLGLAQLTKFTWVILFVLWPAIWILWTAGRKRQFRSDAPQLATCFLIGIYVINFGYCFSGSLTKLGDYEFVSLSLGGSIEPKTFGNRFRGTLLEQLLMPLPRDYVSGIDSQKSDFDRGMPSYLRGKWRDDRGWWYYYLYGIAIKVPLGTWLLILVAAAVTAGDALRTRGQAHLEGGVRCRVSGVIQREDEAAQKNSTAQTEIISDRSGYSASWRDEMVLLVPALAILILVSSQTGFSHHIRYVLPCLPFVYIWASKVARSVELRAWPVAILAAVGLAWSVGSSIWVYPHSLSYFNRLVGGPKGGHWHLGNSNIDWGQDLLLLKRWYDQHPEARPLHLEYDLPLVSPSLAGIDWQPIPRGPAMNRPGSPTTKNWPWENTQLEISGSPNNTAGPTLGWHAISVNRIHRREGTYEYFLEFEPVDMIGYSIYIYHITLSEANRVRKKLGLPELSAATTSINSI